MKTKENPTPLNFKELKNEEVKQLEELVYNSTGEDTSELDNLINLEFNN